MVRSCPAGINFFRVNKSQNLKIKTSDVVLVSLLLTLSRFHTLLLCFHCWLLTSKCQLGEATKRFNDHFKLMHIYENIFSVQNKKGSVKIIFILGSNIVSTTTWKNSFWRPPISSPCSPPAVYLIFNGFFKSRLWERNATRYLPSNKNFLSRKVENPIRITTGPATRMSKWNELVRLRRASTKVFTVKWLKLSLYFDDNPRVQERQQPKD